MEPLQESVEPKDLKYYISLINSSDAINHVEQVTRSFIAHLQTNKENFPQWKENDARLFVFLKCINTLSYYKLNLYYTSGILAETNNFST